MVNNNNKRLAKNSLIMYIQLLLGIIISFIIGRVLLQTLGASDFGTYNVVAGFVSSMAIISGPMISGIQRFFAYDIGIEDYEQLSRDFNTTNIIYIFLGIIIVLLLETLGLWFVNTQMEFENGRMNVVNWVYQLSIFSFFFNVIAQPFNALLFAHENIVISSIFSIIEKIGTLVIVLSLSLIPYDHLKIYSTFMFILAIFMRLLPQIYCKRKYKETKFKINWDKKYFKSIFSYSAFNSIGVLSGVANEQGVNVLLNIFFGPVINAARAISTQMQNIVQSFYFNIYTPTKPQVAKYYARNELEDMWTLINRVSKIIFYTCMVVAIPLGLEAEYVLKLWLGNYPNITPTFLRISIISSLFMSSSALCGAILQAANKIKREQTLVATVTLLTLPISYFFLKMGAEPAYPLIIAAVLQLISIIVQIEVVRYELKKNMKFYYIILARLYSTFLISLVIPFVVVNLLPSSFLRVIITTFVSVLFCTIFMYVISLDKEERTFIKNIARTLSERVLHRSVS